MRKQIPNMITLCNLLSGILGVIFALKGDAGNAFKFMLLSAVFDFCDGFAARLLKVVSPVGKELDSLADVVSFGVLPSVMLYSLSGSYFPLLIAAFSAYRLAVFNLDESQGHSFKGLPTPACALLCGALAAFASRYTSDFSFMDENVGETGYRIAAWISGIAVNIHFIRNLTIALCFLLVSRIPMFSLKFSAEDSKALKWKRLTLLGLAVLFAILTVSLHMNFSLVFLLTFLSYILKNLVYAALKI